MSHLTDAQIEIQLEELSGWSREGDAIVKTFVFKGFIEAISFMTEAAFHAEDIEHHPEWRNLYNEVSVRLTTIEVNGISSHDIRLAKRMNDIAAQKGA